MNQRNRRSAIESALGAVYEPDRGPQGTMVAALAADLDLRWNTIADRASDRSDTHGYALALTIWNWYPGRNTAEIAAGRVLQAVAALQVVGVAAVA